MNIHEAKTHLSKLIERVAAGEEIVISKAGKPVAKLVPYSAQTAPRTGGFLAGQIWEAADCWEPDAELTDAMTKTPLFPEERHSSKVAEEAPPRRRK
jgi:prevent-host-death family protein